MNPFRSHFGGEADGDAGGDAGTGEDGGLFDGYDEFVPENIPVPGAFLQGHDVLAGEDHVAFHDVTRELFEERTVYDMTFNYNLARLNLDTRHENAGYRYAEEVAENAKDDDEFLGEENENPGTTDDRRVLRAEFTPTTPFCPQTHTLTMGSFRAWNGLADRHEYDLVRVRADEMHHESEQINQQLADLEATYLETGDLSANPNQRVEVGSTPMERAKSDEGPSRGPQAPF
ncbi:hypothetical protein [Halorussus litoreus]|uniref:hypothetical protein n=1 Tax=Halorussus litoreus TaxID=1710536 RepID=UPI001E438B1C|nr:hypothetical protein [Halorussus litoreus]